VERAILRIGNQDKEMSLFSASVRMTLLRSAPSFLYLVALSLFLGSFGLLALGFRNLYEQRLETLKLDVSMQTQERSPGSRMPRIGYENVVGGDGDAN
jgi:hypothetical protein